MIDTDSPVSPLSSIGELLALCHRAHVLADGEAPPGAEAGPDDEMSRLDHGLQCAHLLRQRRPDDLELQIAGLVHDLGSTAVPGDADGHGRHGRVLLSGLLGERVGALVELHVAAKRYLVTVDEQYRRRLSPGSVRTLGEQGGLMSADEVVAFEAEPHHLDAVELRRADEGAKVPGRVVPPMEDWVPRIEALIAARTATA